MTTETLVSYQSQILSERPKAASRTEVWCAPGTGFDVRAESNKFIRTLQNKVSSGQPAQSAVDELLTFASEDLRQWAAEFPLNRLVYLYYLEEDEATGEIVAPKYNRQSLISLSDEEERLGKVREAAIKTQDALKAAKPGDLVINTSPPGKTWKKAMPEHLDSLTFAIEKLDSKNYRARTIRTRMDLAENEALQKFLGFDQEIINPDGTVSLNPTVEERILNVVTGVTILRDPKGGSLTAEYVAQALQLIRQTHGHTDAYKGRGFDEIYQDISLGDRLMEVNSDIKQFAEPLITRLQQKINEKRGLFVESNFYLDPHGRVVASREVNEAVVEIEKLIGETMMKINKSIREAKLVDMEEPLTEEQVRKEQAELKKQEGCNISEVASDMIEITVMTPQGPRRVRVPKKLECPTCHSMVEVKSQIVSCRCGARLDLATDPCLGG